jgi:heme exporter protein A
MPYDMHAQLLLADIAFERNFQWLFRGINASVNAGDILQIVGANGAGKSTLLRMLGGYMEPAQGNILWQQKPINQWGVVYQQQLHYLGHQNGLKPTLTIMENLRLGMALAAQPFHANQARQILDELHIARHANQPVISLSAGQCRRAALARLLLKPCQLWLLDEPATALDTQGQALLKKYLQEHQQRGGITILAAHQELGLSNAIQKIVLG